jgi:hypothetical protein
MLPIFSVTDWTMRVMTHLGRKKTPRKAETLTLLREFNSTGRVLHRPQ